VSCGENACLNPAHLELRTRRPRPRRRPRPTAGRAGRRLITAAELRAIVDARARGETWRTIGERHHLDTSSVAKAYKRAVGHAQRSAA
jgi:hypothetical protein